MHLIGWDTVDSVHTRCSIFRFFAQPFPLFLCGFEKPLGFCLELEFVGVGGFAIVLRRRLCCWVASGTDRMAAQSE